MRINGNRLFVIIIALFLIGVFVYEFRSPKEFVWQPSFSRYDKEPFGSYVFDDIVAASVDSFAYENRTFYQLAYPDDGTVSTLDDAIDPDNAAAEELDTSDTIVAPLPHSDRQAYLVTENGIGFTETDLKALLRLVGQGHQVMLCLSYLPHTLSDSLNITINYHDFYSFGNIRQYARKGLQRDTVLLGPDTLRPEGSYGIYPHLCPSSLRLGTTDPDSIAHLDSVRCDSLRILAWNNHREPIAVQLSIGYGELLLVTTPLMFTNYGMLDGANASYAFRLLSYMKNRPLIRILAYGNDSQPSASPLRYLLSQPPLRWAIYLSLSAIVLFMIFTAKRRQRAIPVVNRPANRTLQFTQLIGTLYYQRKDYKEMLQKKYLYFATEAKRIGGIDLLTDEPDEVLSHRLAQKLGVDTAELHPDFRELKQLLHDHTTVTETAMMHHIDRLNTWIKLLTN